MNPVIAFSGLWVSLPWAAWKRQKLRQIEKRGQGHFSNIEEKNLLSRKKDLGDAAVDQITDLLNPKAFISTRSLQVTYKKPTSDSGEATAGHLSYSRRHKAAASGQPSWVSSHLFSWISSQFTWPCPISTRANAGWGWSWGRGGMGHILSVQPGLPSGYASREAPQKNMKWNILQFSPKK